MKELVILVYIIQALTIITSVYLIFLEWKYCKQEKWWYDIGVALLIALEFIPIAGILLALATCADTARNMTNTLSKRLEEKEND